MVGTYLVELGYSTGRVDLCADHKGARRDWAIRLGAYVVFLLLVYIGDRFSGPPEIIKEVASTGPIGVAVLLVCAWWFDRHRDAVFANAGGR